MKRGLALAALAWLWLAPRPALALELTFSNAEQCEAAVALAYERGGLCVTAGWHRLAPGQILTVKLFQVDRDEVYAHVAFEYPHIIQQVEDAADTVERLLRNTHFRYTGIEPDGPLWRRATFYRISPPGNSTQKTEPIILRGRRK